MSTCWFLPRNLTMQVELTLTIHVPNWYLKNLQETILWALDSGSELALAHGICVGEHESRARSGARATLLLNQKRETRNSPSDLTSRLCASVSWRIAGTHEQRLFFARESSPRPQNRRRFRPPTRLFWPTQAALSPVPVRKCLPLPWNKSKEESSRLSQSPWACSCHTTCKNGRFALANVNYYVFHTLELWWNHLWKLSHSERCKAWQLL